MTGRRIGSESGKTHPDDESAAVAVVGIAAAAAVVVAAGSLSGKIQPTSMHALFFDLVVKA